VTLPTPTIAQPFGYLQPTLTNNELNDLVLRHFLQGLVVGITGMIPEFVRPRWQPEPPNEPDFTQDWAAIGTISRTRDVNAAELHSVSGTAFPDPSDVVVRNEILEIIASFYGPNSEQNAETFAMGMSLAQNREACYLNGFGVVEVGESLTVPALLKERWLQGQDVHFSLRRQQVWCYAIPGIDIANITLKTDTGLSVAIKIQQ
jgi:hypothetical protein